MPHCYGFVIENRAASDRPCRHVTGTAGEFAECYGWNDFHTTILVAAADSDTNIQNIFNVTISDYCDTLSLVILKIKLKGNQERNLLVLGPVSGP